MGFDDLNSADLQNYGISQIEAAKRLHILHDGQVISGIPAFLVIWSLLPNYRWLSALMGLPVIKHIAICVYDYILAPALFWADQRRRKRRS